MKSVSEVLHKTPWWVLFLGGAAIFAGLVVFVTPYHILQYRENRGTEESRAIKREVDNALAENAISVGRGVVRGMLSRTTDPERRAELEQALAGLEEARRELRESTSEALQARRETLEAARAHTRETREAVREAQRELQQGAPTPEERGRARELERALSAAERAERAAERALRRVEREARSRMEGKPRGSIDIQIDLPKPEELKEPPEPDIRFEPEPRAHPPVPVLPPELASRIRRDVTGDMYRFGIGAALIVVLIPLFIVAVVVKFFADRSRASQRIAEAKRREAEYHRMAQQVTEAKLAALQAQVEPHFLYNTLASVQALTEVDPARASEMTGHLIHYLRNALPKMRESVSTVGQEIELARAYLSILQMRMDQRLSFEIDVPAELMDKPFPPLMLPSLVENAIKHGLEPQREGGMVRISATRVEGRLRMVVTDTGRGFSDTPGAGVGLANIRERLAALYGGTARLTLEANVPHGVVATIDVPAEGARATAPGQEPATASATASRPATATPSAGTPEPPDGLVPPIPDASPASATAASTIWARTWNGLGVMERIWRMALWYLYLGLVALLAVAAIGGAIALAVDAIPMAAGNELLDGPLGILVALAAAVIAFVAISAALAVVLMVVYGLGFFVLALLVFVLLVVLVALSPVLAPIVLVGLGIWWLARRGRQPAAPRVEPRVSERGP